MMKTRTLLALILFLAQVCLAQKEGNIWYFGEKAGFDFNTTPPTPLTGKLITQEGCSSIADRNTEQLLLYTDGITVVGPQPQPDAQQCSQPAQSDTCFQHTERFNRSAAG